MLLAGAVFVAAALILYFIPGIGVETYSLGCLFLFSVPFIVGLGQSVHYVKSFARVLKVTTDSLFPAVPKGRKRVR